MQNIREWLAGIGLGQYADALERNDVDLDVLPELTEADLQALGVSLGHRRRLLAAVRDAQLASRRPASPGDAASHPPVESLTAEGERRQVTVLFCDLVGSTALSHRLDPEEYRHVLGRYHETCIACVQRFEGYVAQIQGDGMVAYFGYPLAHEGEAERAILAALSIVQSLAVLDVGLGQALAVRIGVASGLVVVSHVLAPDKSAVGDTPNLAQRLQTLAQPGEVMASERTRVLAAGAFDYADCGMHLLKGIPAPTPVWKVTGLSGAASRFEAATGGALWPMVGREQEIALLQSRWELSRAGEGQVVLLAGEPGIGKSRMLQAFRERIGERIELTLQYQCSPHHVNGALYPIIDQLERALGFVRDETAAQKLDRLERRIAREFGRNLHDCCLLACAMSLPGEERYGALDMSPQRRKEATIALLVDLVAQAARQRATAVLFEDVHWADSASLDVLNALIDRTATLPLLVLISYRPEFEPAWTSRSHVTPIGLTRLSRAQGASIILRVAGRKALPADLVAQIVDKTDGVPLFLEELTKAVLESDLLVETGGRYDYSRQDGKLSIPATLRDSLMARLDRLMPVKEIAQIGACLGREFSHELVQAVSPMHATQVDEALERLAASELVFRRGSPPSATYVFKHALVQDAAYDSLLKSKRQSLHARIAAAIQERFPAKALAEPELLAHHYTRAGLLDEALKYWEMAGELAQQRFALREAVNSFRQAVQLLALMDKSAELMQRHIDIAVRWADLIVPSQDVIEALEAAVQYADQLADASRLVRARSYLGQLLFYLGESERAARHLQQVIAMRDQLPERDRVGSAYRCLGQLYLFAYSRYSEAIPCIERALPIVHASGNRFEESCCHGLLGLELGFRGRFEHGFAAFDSAIEVARTGQERSIECWEYMWRSHIHVLAGDWEAAAADAQSGIALGRKIENAWAVDWCTVMDSYAGFMVHPDTSLITPASEAVERLSGTVCVSGALCYVADMLCASGSLDEADRCADRALDHLRYGSYFSARLRAHCIKGMIAANRPDPRAPAVDVQMREAIEIARQEERAPDLAICHLRHAALLLASDRRADTQTSLGEAERLFSQMQMTRRLAEARALRTQL